MVKRIESKLEELKGKMGDLNKLEEELEWAHTLTKKEVTRVETELYNCRLDRQNTAEEIDALRKAKNLISHL